MSKIILTNQKRKRLSYDGNSIVEHKFTIHVALLSILITFRKDCRFTAASRKFLSYSAAARSCKNRVQRQSIYHLPKIITVSYFTSSCGNCDALACQHVCNCINNIDEMYAKKQFIEEQYKYMRTLHIYNI